MSDDIPASTREFLVNKYGEEGAKLAALEIRHWLTTGRLPTNALFIAYIERAVDGSLIIAHLGDRLADGGC